ncbi:ras association domain-containing protein 8-like isoform 1-T2 [Synchiropus picturatus]
MELKVLVEGVARVVCGITSETPCQDIVIALAQAIGRTGRYVLIMKLRGTEKLLLADECPLRHLTQLGQLAAEVKFVLRRKGPSLSDKPEMSDQRLLRLPKPFQQEALSEPQRALSFTHGPSSSEPWLKPNHAWSLRASPEPHRVTNKEEVFRQILQQRRKLKNLESEIQVLELETREWERMCAACLPSQTPTQEDPAELERLQQLNQAELLLVEDWELLLHSELERETDLHLSLQQIQRSIDDHGIQIHREQERAAHLEQDVQLIVDRERSQLDDRESIDALQTLKKQLQHRVLLGQDLDSELSGADRALKLADQQIQEKWELIEDLNKELRQCNLQQFIMQTGGAPNTEQMQALHSSGIYLHNAGILK